MRLEFIDNNTAIDRAARRRIRSHVARGRNAGKTLMRQSRSVFGPRLKSATASIHELKSIEDVVPEIESQISDGLSFPARLSSGSRSLIRRGMFRDLEMECYL